MENGGEGVEVDYIEEKNDKKEIDFSFYVCII